MSGLPCAKVIIDNNHGLSQAMATHVAVIERQLGCMSNSITLSAGRGTAAVFPTEEMEGEFLSATTAFLVALKMAAGPLLDVGAKIAVHCDPTKPSPAG